MGLNLYFSGYAMRFKDSHEQQVHLREATAAGNVELVYAGLDVLGSTPWKINKGIFETVVKVWNSGDRMGKIPPATFDQPEPVLSEEGAKDLQSRSHHIQRVKAWAQAKANNHSERCNVNYKVEIARAVRCPLFVSILTFLTRISTVPTRHILLASQSGLPWPRLSSSTSFKSHGR